MGGQARLQVDPSNAGQGAAWDGYEGNYWAAHPQEFDDGLASYRPAFEAAADIQPSSRVLDVGCGTGQTTRDAARRASNGSAVGVDLSERMVDVARDLADHEGVENATFLQADAQVHRFGAESFDIAISRTGTMFFGDPRAAFTNIARAVRPDGRLTMLTWQPAARNEWIVAISTALAAGRDLPQPPPDAPGPFSLSDPDRIQAVLVSAGFTDVQIEGLDRPMSFGRDPGHATQFIVGLLGWMLDGLDEADRNHAIADLEVSTEAHHTPGGVRYDSAAWLVTAHRVTSPGT
jgi:SAM-dependent methyltransferase